MSGGETCARVQARGGVILRALAPPSTDRSDPNR